MSKFENYCNIGIYLNRYAITTMLSHYLITIIIVNRNSNDLNESDLPCVLYQDYNR